MKLILSVLILFLFSSNIYAESKTEKEDRLKEEKILKKINDKYAREKAKREKEWNDPHNKYIRELTKKHYGKDTNETKEERKRLHQNLIDSQ